MANFAKTIKSTQKKVDSSVRSLGFNRRDIKKLHAFEHEVAVNVASNLLLSAAQEVVTSAAAAADAAKSLLSKKSKEEEETDDEVEVVEDSEK